MSPQERAARLHMFELWFKGHNTARIARKMRMPESEVYRALSRRVLSNMRAEMHRLRREMVSAA